MKLVHDEVASITIQVNPPTAFNMIHDFVDLERGDWIMQNGKSARHLVGAFH